jgi:tRNA threonylcarbamoyladenosine biosynthesis protein TsaE
MGTSTSNSPDETAALGEAVGGKVLEGTVIVLAGTLGAGKTQWVKGFARGLGVTEGVHSPTFSLINIYEGGRLTIFHIDLYRLENREEIVRAGLAEYFDPPGVAVVEWGDKWFSRNSGALAAGAGLRRVEWVTIESVNESTRRITHEHPGR